MSKRTAAGKTDLDPEQLARDLVDYSRKLGVGMEALKNASDIDVGQTAKDVVYAEDKLVLYRYRKLGRRRKRIPLLVIYALVNRPYMMDLQPDRSMIRGLLEEGIDVFLIDWGYPDRLDRHLTLSDYICGYVKRCVDAVRRITEQEQISLLGVCQGGTFSLCYTALFPKDVATLITMVTPVDFKTRDNLLSHWISRVDIDGLVDTLGNIPGEFLNWTFLSLKPFRLTGQKYVNFIEMIDDSEKLENFLRMEKWIFDSPDQAGEAFREFVSLFFRENRLIKGGLKLGGNRVALKNITQPVLNVYATADHLVPPSASLAMRGRVGTDDYSEHAFPGGHIGIYVSSRARREIPSTIANWLRARY